MVRIRDTQTSNVDRIGLEIFGTFWNRTKSVFLVCVINKRMFVTSNVWLNIMFLDIACGSAVLLWPFKLQTSCGALVTL